MHNDCGDIGADDDGHICDGNRGHCSQLCPTSADYIGNRDSGLAIISDDGERYRQVYEQPETD
jgi:hypothetical protein